MRDNGGYGHLPDGLGHLPDGPGRIRDTVSEATCHPQPHTDSEFGPVQTGIPVLPPDIKIRKTWPLLPDGLAGPHQQQRRPSDDGRGPAQRDFIHGGLRQHD